MIPKNSVAKHDSIYSTITTNNEKEKEKKDHNGGGSRLLTVSFAF